jgi:hypothetical protein
VTPLYPQKFIITSPMSGGLSVGIVRSQTQATEFVLSVVPQLLKSQTAFSALKHKRCTSTLGSLKVTFTSKLLNMLLLLHKYTEISYLWSPYKKRDVRASVIM